MYLSIQVSTDLRLSQDRLRVCIWVSKYPLVWDQVKLGYVYVSEYPNIHCFETKLGKVRIFVYLIIHVSTDLRPM